MRFGLSRQRLHANRPPRELKRFLYFARCGFSSNNRRGFVGKPGVSLGVGLPRRCTPSKQGHLRHPSNAHRQGAPTGLSWGLSATCIQSPANRLRKLAVVDHGKIVSWFRAAGHSFLYHTLDGRTIKSSDIAHRQCWGLGAGGATRIILATWPGVTPDVCLMACTFGCWRRDGVPGMSVNAMTGSNNPLTAWRFGAPAHPRNPHGWCEALRRQAAHCFGSIAVSRARRARMLPASQNEQRRSRPGHQRLHSPRRQGSA